MNHNCYNAKYYQYHHKMIDKWKYTYLSNYRSAATIKFSSFVWYISNELIGM